MRNEKGLIAKDLINIGIFTALYFISFFCTGMLAFIPIFMILIPLICPIIAGIPMMLYVTKVKKFGMILIMSLIVGCLMTMTGHGWYPIVSALICGFVYELILKAGNYQSSKCAVFGYAVFSFWLVGPMMPLYIATESYAEQLIQGFGQEYADSLMGYMEHSSILLSLAFCFIGGLIGAFIGRAVLKKHFVKAGIA